MHTNCEEFCNTYVRTLVNALLNIIGRLLLTNYDAIYSGHRQADFVPFVPGLNNSKRGSSSAEAVTAAVTSVGLNRWRLRGSESRPADSGGDKTRFVFVFFTAVISIFFFLFFYRGNLLFFFVFYCVFRRKRVGLRVKTNRTALKSPIILIALTRAGAISDIRKRILHIFTTMV